MEYNLREGWGNAWHLAIALHDVFSVIPRIFIYFF